MLFFKSSFYFHDDTTSSAEAYQVSRAETISTQKVVIFMCTDDDDIKISPVSWGHVIKIPFFLLIILKWECLVSWIKMCYCIPIDKIGRIYLV